MIPALNASETSAACLGNHDLDFGVEQFEYLAGLCKFPWLCGNALDDDDGESVALGNCRKSVMLTTSDGLKVGVMGLVEREWLDTINTLPPNLKFLEPETVARELAAELRKQGAEIVIALNHQREPNDIELAESLERGIVDTILSGHDHYDAHSETNGTHILRSGSDFKQLSYLEAWKRTNENVGSGPSWNFRIVRRDVVCSISPDAKVDEMVEKITASLRPKLEKPIGYTVAPLDARFTTVRTKESNMGNWVCDFMRYHYNADCCLMAAGTIRGDQVYPPGRQGLSHLSAIVAALENGVSKYPALEGRFPQVSGITFCFDPARPAISRCSNVKINGEVVQLEKEYTMARTEYMVRGKDGFTSLLLEYHGGVAKSVVGDETGMLISMLLRQYFMSLKILGRWKNWSAPMGRHWANVHEDFHEVHLVREPVKPGETLPTTSREHSRTVAGEIQSGSAGLVRTALQSGSSRQNHLKYDYTHEHILQHSDSEDEHSHRADLPAVRNMPQNGHQDTGKRERELMIMRRVMRKWWRIAKLPGHPAMAEDHGEDFGVHWTKGICPRVEERIVMIGGQWHLSTPTPYDPPLTYGGWNQSRSLGVRIASLLHAREQATNDALSEPTKGDGVTSYDFAQRNGGSPRSDESRKRKRKHKVVIHSSPFLRCVQTSVAIAAGMAQFQPPSEAGSRPSTSRSRTPNTLHSASPRLRALEGKGSPNLAPISEPRDFAHVIARRVLAEHKRHRRCKLRVDAFLGEWLNPGYFDHITPPPPSALMLATAKAELMRHESVDIFTPTISTKTSQSSLWGGASNLRGDSKDSTSEDWEEPQDTLPPSPSRRDRTGSMSSIGSNDSASGRRSPFRQNHATQAVTSSIPKPETTVYVPPTPHYAISSSDHIPRGYIAHARQSCVNVDYQWDSSRPPQNWGDGGELGEEWSQMHKRFRKGLNHLIHWYSQHNVDDRAEDALGFDQAERHALEAEVHDDDDEVEDLVVVLVTHGAGCNALIGALTGQPVLLDVGMASLTVATRRDNAHVVLPPVASRDVEGNPGPSPSPEETLSGQAARRVSLDLGLSSIYEMKLVSSSEHLRPGADPRRAPSLSSRSDDQRSGLGAPSKLQDQRGSSNGREAADTGFADWSLTDSSRSSSSSRSGTSSMLGSAVRRPSVPVLSSASGGLGRSNTLPVVPGRSEPGSPGLWTPPGAGSTPVLKAKEATSDQKSVGEALPEPAGAAAQSIPASVIAKAATSDHTEGSSRSTAMSLALSGALDGAADTPLPPAMIQNALAHSTNGINETHGSPPQVQHTHDHKPSLSNVSDLPAQPPQSLGRTMSQKGLWGAKPGGDKVRRDFGEGPKKRWTLVVDE
ncbi:hypothetical protein LTR78_006837 [Recurvomyces mirabilis]|uniref:5'-Nucleotidase C-terminal domain-containing protein n=1 Tax=Recurvomyces mirabilis TaxID=574656 RepID=A0AAE0WKB3_9PEZI|nr:hypothetical protein LTR78_006837 [Recurvomyces mirabilis]KAK5153172.1 hypothetical protein LTS14_007817 [Recurvomyces mirabilis]